MLACDKNDLCCRILLEAMPKKDLHAMHAEYGLLLNRVCVETNKFEDKMIYLKPTCGVFNETCKYTASYYYVSK